MEAHTFERRLVLGGTAYAGRLVRAFVKHPEITEVLTTEVTTTGKAGNYAADLRIVYRAGRRLTWEELLTTAGDVPLYEVPGSKQKGLVDD